MFCRLAPSAALRAAMAFTSRSYHLSAALQSVEVKMPSLSPTMTEGTIVKWAKKEGESVSAGDVLCEIQTDKAVVSLEVDDDGTVAKIIKNPDSGTINVGTIIALMAEDGEDWKEVAEKGITSSTEEQKVGEEQDSAAASSGSVQGTEVKMPSLSPTMTEGTIVKWCKNEGDSIAAGDVLCEIQTDKAVVSMEVDDDAVVAKIIVPEGQSGVKINTLIALTVEEGQDWKDVIVPGKSKSETTKKAKKKTMASGGNTPGTQVKMPSLSPTMTEGTIVKWCKSEGDTVAAGDVLCEIQTDKAVVSMELDDDAVLAKILVPEGQSGVKINTLIAMTVQEGDDWKDVQIPAQEEDAEDVVEVGSDTKMESVEVVESDGISHVEHVPHAGPAVMLLCALYGIDPSKVKPTGPKGMLKSDVMQYVTDNALKPIKITAKKSKPSKKEEAKPKPEQGATYTDTPLTSMRAVIAKRLKMSKSTSPHGYSTVDCNINTLNSIRADFLKSAGIKISVNDLLIKAAATALQHVPEVNLNTVGDDDYQFMPNIDISVAVATPNGLITPIVKDVVTKSLPEISNAVRDLAVRAKDGKLQLDEFQGGTFTISNLGMFGVKEFTAIINPPQCAIMAVGTGRTEIDPESGNPYSAMRATLSFDRRFIDEKTAADFMSTFQRVIEKPEYMNIGLAPVVRRTIMEV